MLIPALEVIDQPIKCTDGKVSEVADIIFDENEWNIIYLSGDIEFGNYEKRIAFAPDIIRRYNDKEKTIELNLKKQVLAEGPSLQKNVPISREKEIELAQYFNWPLRFTNISDLDSEEAQVLAQHMAGEKASRSSNSTEPLRSVRELVHYTVRGKDGETGELGDFIIDDQSWKIRYLIIDLNKWLPGGKKTLISPAFVKRIEWEKETVYLGMQNEVVKEGPEWHPGQKINEDFELDIFKYYGNHKIMNEH